ncbi:UNVERIFIED_CONTAM: hypothetical protein Slati_4202800 [Sesamum latifolium]|uniref:DUF4283 domain-containing protein n=1 Tax=Sesamum latifolium TaxID=2727402 RepID=A0AAW2TAB6_9LAMI
MVSLQCFASFAPINLVKYCCSTFLPIVSSFEQVFRPGNLYSPVRNFPFWLKHTLDFGCTFCPFPQSARQPAFLLKITVKALFWELQPPAPLALVGSITSSVLAAMAKGKKAKLPAASAGRPKHSGHPSSNSVSVISMGNSQGKPSSVPAPINATVAAGQHSLAPVSDATTTAQVSTMVAATSMGKTQVGSSKFHDFISELKTPPPIAKTVHAVHVNSGPRTEETSPGQGGVSVDNGTKKASFAGLFSTNRRITTETKLAKFAVENGTLTLEPTDLVNVRAKMGHYLVGYVAGKFPGLRAIRALAQSWGASFYQHDSGWLIFRFARDEDRQRVMAGGPYFIYGRPILLKIMPDCFEFKEDDISSTPVWAILPSLPLECWHPNVLGKIGSRLGTPIAMDSLTMTMEHVSYARILVEVDASKKLVGEVEFILPNGVTRKQRVVYEFTPIFARNATASGT